MGPRRRLTIREALELSPWAKWLLYGIVPWKMILHLLLVFFITLQASLVNERSAAYSRAVGRSFLSLFFPTAQATTDPGAYRYYIYTINDTILHAHRLLDTYFELPEVSVDALEVAPPTADAHAPTAAGGCPTWVELRERGSSTSTGKKAGGSSSTDNGGDGCTLPLPVITLAYHARAAPQAAYVAGNASAPWPLQVGGQVDAWLKEEAQGQNLQQLRDFFDSLRSVTFDFAVRSRGWGGGSLQSEQETCILWSLSFLYDLSVGGQFTVSMRHRPLRRCTPLELADQYIVLCILIGVLAFVYELLLIKSVLDKYRIFQLLSGGGSSRAPIQPATSLQSQSHLHEASPLLGGGGGSHHQPHQQHYHATSPAAEDSAADDDGPTGGRPVVAAATVAAANSNLAGGVVGWEALTWWDQIEILNVWTLVAMAGCVCVLLFAGLALRARDDLMVDGALRVLVGLASLLLWLALIQYLEYDPRYYTLVLTIRRAVPRIVQFVGGIVPMFIGYCLLGTILFGDRTEHFGSLAKTAATLFCVVNGDSIKLALDSVSYVPVVGALYIVVYLCLFAYVCLMTMIAITEECFFSSAEYAHLVWTGGVTAEHDDAAKAPPADDDDDDNDDDERSSFGSHHHPPYTSSTYYQQQHHEPVLQPLLEEEAAAALAAGGGGGSGGAFDLPITIAPPPPTPAMDSRRGGVGGHRSTSPLRHAHAPMPLRPPPTWSGAVLPSHDPAASGRSSASESAPVSQAALTAPAAPPRSSTASPVSLPLSTSPGPSSGGGGGSGAFPLRDPTEPGNPPPMLLKRSASGSRVMSHKLKSLLQAVEASELAAAPTEGCRSASVTPTAAVAMGAGGGGASGGERRGSVPGGSVEEGQGGGGAPSAAAVAEALDELQAQLLRQLNAGRGEEGAGAGMGAVDAGAGGSNSAGAVLQAIAATRDRLLVRRRRAPSSRLATQPEEGEEGEG